MLSILSLLYALALGASEPSTIQTQSLKGEFLIDLNCGPFDSANCTSARISLERVCNSIASDLKIKVPIKIQVNFTKFSDDFTIVSADEGQPIIARKYSGSKLGPTVAFPRALAKQAKIISDSGDSVQELIHAPHVYDLRLAFNSGQSWVFGSDTALLEYHFDLDYRFAREMTKALGFNSNLEFDKRSDRTTLGPKISTVTVVNHGHSAEKWYVNYFTQFDSILYASSYWGDRDKLPAARLLDPIIFKALDTQFESFLESQKAFYDDYLGMQAGPFKSAINKLDQFLGKYKYGFAIRLSHARILWMEPKSPGNVISISDRGYNDLMKIYGDEFALQDFLQFYWDEMNNNSIYTDDYLEVFRMIGWGTRKADNELVLKMDETSIKLAKQRGL